MPDINNVDQTASSLAEQRFFHHLEELAERDVRLLCLLQATLGRLVLREVSRPSGAFCSVGDYWDGYGSDFSAHIRDWLKSAIVNNLAWLANVDGRGLPKKISKLGSLAALRKEADKQMTRATARLRASPLEEGHEETVTHLGHGWAMVRLLSPTALDRESVRMQHCIGHGSYDRRLLEGTHRYLSLRDPSGNPHATLEVEHTTDSTGNPVVQLQGKQNRRPLRKYLEKVAAYLERSEVKLYGHDYGMIRDIRGRIHFLDDLPEILEIDQSLTISAKDGEVLRLPRVIRCRKLSLSGTCFANTPEEIVATELLVLEGDLPLPKSLKVDGQLTIARSNIRELPSHLNVGSLTLYDTPNLELPDGLVVDGLLDLASSRMAITAIPSDTKFRDINISNRNIAVFDTSGYLPPRNGDDPAPTLIAQNGQLREIRGVKRFSRFEVANCDWTSLPDDLEVTHVLDISGTAIRTIPQGAVPEIMLVATDCRDLTLPSELDCEWVDLTGATVRMPKTVTCAGEIVLKNAKVTLIAEVMRAERISFEGAQIASLPDVIEAEVINLKHSSVRTLPNGLVAASVFISSGPLSIQPDTRLETLNVIIKQGIYSNHQNLSLDDARKAIEERGGVGLGEGAVARFMVYDDDFWHMIDRYPILESKRKSRKTGRHAFSVSSMKAFISQFLAGSRESTLAS